MTTATGSEEVDLLKGMEREPEVADPQKPVAREYTFSIVRGLVNIHGMVHSVADVVSALAGKVRSLADRGPDPDYAPDRSVPKIAISGDGSYHQKSDWPRRRNAIIDGLLIAGIIALVSTSIYLLKTTVRLDTQYEERGQLYEYRFRTIEGSVQQQGTELRRHDERLDRLEQQRRDAQRND